MKLTFALIVVFGVWASVNATYRGCLVQRVSNGVTKKNGKTLPRHVTHISRNDKLTYECNNGYRLTGSSTRVCRYTKLDGVKAACVKITTCSWPGAPSKGSVKRGADTDRANVGDYATFSCISGYKLHGSYRAKCLNSGKFSPLNQSCRRVTCTVPEEPDNGSIRGVAGDVDSGDSVAIGTVIRFYCNSGYKLQGHYQSKCQSSGMFSPLGQSCKAITCKVPDAPDNGDITGGNPGDIFDFGDSIGFECDGGYVLTGSNTAQCGANGNFSPLNQNCRRKYKPCSKPVIKYGRGSEPKFEPDQSSYSHGSKLKVTCPKKYSPGGYRPGPSFTQHTCNNGNWVKPVRRSCASSGGGYYADEDIHDFFDGDVPPGFYHI